MRKVIKKTSIILCLVFILSLVVNHIPSLDQIPKAKAETTEKAKLTKTEGTMGVGCEPTVIQIENTKHDAKYTYTPANKKMIRVTENEGLGIIYSSEVGKTTVTVKEVYKGKTTEVGIFTIHVVHAQMNETKMEIGISSYNTISLEYVNTNATYQYKSSNSKVASVSEEGYITGKKYGKTTITVSETYKGKTVTVGTCTITVTIARLAVKELEIPIYEGGYDSIPIACRNNTATYQYKSSDPNVVRVDKYGIYSGLKEGKSTVTVTETMNKTSKKLGKIIINVVLASIDPKCKIVVIGINSSTSFNEIIDEYYNMIAISNRNRYATYTFKSADSSIVSIETDYNTWDLSPTIKGVGIGTTTLTVYEEYKEEVRTVGTVEIEVKEYPVTDFAFHISGESEQGMITKSFNLGWVYDLRFCYIIRPVNCTTPVTFVSEDETIATVDNEGRLTPIKVGKVEITATCGDYTDKMLALVVDEEE